MPITELTSHYIIAWKSITHIWDGLIAVCFFKKETLDELKFKMGQLLHYPLYCEHSEELKQEQKADRTVL